MWYVLNIINGIKKRKILSFLIVIQLIASFSLLLFSVNLVKNLLFIKDYKNWAIETKELYLVNIDNSDDDSKKDIVYNELIKNEYIDTVATFSYDYYGIEDELGSYSMPLLKVDKNFYGIFRNIVEYGDGFSEEDFEEGETSSVIVGGFYKDEFEMNSSITLLDLNEYIVKGFISRDKLTISDRNTMYIDMNKAILVPIKNTDYGLDNIIVKLVQGADIRKVENNNVSGNIKLDFINLNEFIMEDVNLAIEDEKYSIIMSIIGSIFCIIGLTVATNLSLWVRKREFGIRYALGESRFSMLLGVIIENILICLIGVICAVVYYYNCYKDLIIESNKSFELTIITSKLGVEILIVMFLILIVVIVLCSFLAFLFTRKIEPKDLIGGLH